MRRKGIEFAGALKLVANMANISLPTTGVRLYQPSEAIQAAEKTRGAFDPDQYRPLVPGGKVHEYLTSGRKLPATLLDDYNVGETTDGEAYSFAYKWRPASWPASRERPLFEFCKRW